MRKELILEIYNDFARSASIFRSSREAYQPFKAVMAASAETMITYDAMSFRFQKYVEMGAHLFRPVEVYFLKDESLTYRDCLLRMEKLGVIASAEDWVAARDLRNRIAHEYDPQRLEDVFAHMFALGGRILEDRARAEGFLKQQGVMG